MGVEQIMSGFEIAAYLGIYALVVAVGLLLAKNSVKTDKATDIEMPYANENYEQPRLGTGIGAVRPNATYVKLSNQRRAS